MKKKLIFIFITAIAISILTRDKRRIMQPIVEDIKPLLYTEKAEETRILH